MKHAEIMLKVSAKTGVAPDVCELVVRTLEKAIQEELENKPGVGVLNRAAGFVYRLTLPREVSREHSA